MFQPEKNIDFSIIIPVYNNRDYLKKLTDSLHNQSYKKQFEIIFLDDNSTDGSMDLLKRLIKDKLGNKKNILVSLLHDGENRKQGYRRNQGIHLAKGKWILFLDSDDYIHTETLQTCADRLEKDPDVDMIMFNYGYVNEKDNFQTVRSTYSKSLYQKNNPSQLIGHECERLLSLDTYFTVNKVYRKQFLIDNDIFFGEGYFYEDFIFYVKSSLKAEKIALLPNLFYFVRIHGNSTTKTNYDDTHTKDVYKAIEASSRQLENSRAYYSQYNAVKYFLNRALLYSEIRSNYTEKEKINYINDVINMIHSYIPPQKMNYPNKYFSNLYYCIFKIGFYQNNNAESILTIYKLYREKPSVLKKIANDHRNYKHHYKTKLYRKLALNKYRSLQVSMPKEGNGIDTFEPQTHDMILMLGFDYRYSGNSKYLFEQLAKKYDSSVLKFVCKNHDEINSNIDKDYFIYPNTEVFYDYLKKSKVIIAESWIPLRFKFLPSQTLIQLWHGQPLKKLLFDSYELNVLEWNPTTKQQKSLDISRWNYLISESDYSDTKFKTAMAIEQDKLLPTIYPRNKWLLENKDNAKLKLELKNKLGIPTNKKVVLYLPTWRDYNFKQKNHLKDYNYLLNFERFKEHLENKDDYVFLVKGHEMDQNLGKQHELVYTLNSDEDIQPYYLIADKFITDYSSSLIDALLLDIDSYLLFKDFDYYNIIRGIYDDFISDFKKVISYSEKELADLMNNDYPTIQYDKYLARDGIDLVSFIEEKHKN